MLPRNNGALPTIDSFTPSYGQVPQHSFRVVGCYPTCLPTCPCYRLLGFYKLQCQNLLRWGNILLPSRWSAMRNPSEPAQHLELARTESYDGEKLDLGTAGSEGPFGNEELAEVKYRTLTWWYHSPSPVLFAVSLTSP